VQRGDERTGIDDDVLDLRDLFRRLRRRAHWIGAGALLGVAAALAVTLLMPESYRSTAKILIRDQDASGVLRMGDTPLEMLFRGGRSALATEVEILTSRPLVEEVVDSLALQWRVVRPRGTGAPALFEGVRADYESGPAVRYRLVREGERYVVQGGGERLAVRPGEAVRLAHAAFTLRADTALPDRIDVRLESRRSTLERVAKGLTTKETTSDLVQLTYRADDAATAAAVPDFLVSQYLATRTHTDRNVNRRRLEFLLAHEDSVRAELASAEGALRAYQEASGTFDAALVGERTLDRAMELQGSYEEVNVELGALDALFSGGTRAVGTSELAAYPTFFQNAAINNLLNRILELRARRVELLDRRMEADPDVLVVDANLAAAEAELSRLSTSYRDGLEKQRRELAAALVPYREVIGGIPERLQEQFRLQRETRRLSETLLLIQGQLVQSRLAAIGEGGEVRAIETALPPEDPTWPKPAMFLLLGVVLGGVAGTVAATVRGYTDPVIHGEDDARSAVELPATECRPGDPLLVGGLNGCRVIVVIAASDDPRPATVAAAAILAGARALGRDAVLADLSTGGLEEGAGRLPALQARHELVVVVAPSISRPEALAVTGERRRVLIVAEAGRTRSDELRHAAALLRRVDAPAAGVLVLRGPAAAGWRLPIFRGGRAAAARGS
jgi:uncharacterized protein involved in exopolysaccharide biosynthesis